MQTFQPLSQEERLIIEKIYRTKTIQINFALATGVICVLTGLLPVLLNISDTFLLVIIILLFICGILALLTGIRKRIRHKPLLSAALKIDKKELFTGYLREVEIIRGNKLCYHFAELSKEVILSKPVLLKASITKPVQTLTNISMTLHLVSLASGDHLLLKAMYEKPVYSGEAVSPFTAEDKRQLRSSALSEFKSVAFIVLILGAVMSIGGLFYPPVLIFTMGIPVIIIIGIFIAGLLIFTMSKNKILLTTRITERVQIWVKSGKYSSEQTWYRTDNGQMENLGTSDLQVGQVVRVLFTGKKNGSRGILLGVEMI